MQITGLNLKILTIATAFLAAFSVPALAAEPAVPPTAEPGAAKETAQASSAVKPLPDPVAKVNGAPIPAVDLKRARKVLMAGQGMTEIPADQAGAVDKAALEQLIATELLLQEASKVEVKDLERKIEEKYTQGRSKFPTEEAFKKAIGELDMTEKDLRDYTRRDLVISSFIESAIVAKVTVSDEDAKKFYDQNQNLFTKGESVKASHILIGVDEKASEADRKAAREKADKLRKELEAGADFAALAKANSTCPSSQQGGDLGTFGKGQMVAPFEKAAFTLKPGSISDVVETQFGYHIIKVVEKTPEDKVKFDEVKARIVDHLKGQKVNEAIGTYIENARKSAKVEMFLK